MLESLDPAAARVLLSAVFDRAADAVAIARGDAIWVVNPALLVLFGYEQADQVLDRPIGLLLDPAVHDVRARRRDGSTFDVAVRTTTWRHGGEVFTLWMLRDVGPELAAAEARRARHDLYEAVFEQNTAVKLLIDPSDGQIVDANPAAVEFYGWPRETLRSMRIDEINALAPDQVAAELENARTGKRRYFRFPHRTAGGAIRHVEIHTGALEIDGRTLLLSILHDVSDRHALEARLDQARELEAIGRVARGVAHDFNNLLTVIGTACEGLAQGLGPDDRAREALADILHASRRAGELTKQLLAFGGRQQLESQPVRVHEVLQGVAPLLQRAVGKEIEVRIWSTPELPRIVADPGQLEQVLMNLAINARDAMSGRGVLEIRTWLDEAFVAIAVRDTGCGMDAATRARIFEPFFTTKPRGQGTGLGLASAYGIITQSGGQITVDSEPGRGAEFKVLLPVYRGTPSRPPARVEREVVLLVDDDDETRRVLAERLKDAGYRVVEAASAEEALRTPVASVDALVTDVEMPGRSGLELAAELQAVAPDLPVVVISGRPVPHGLLPRQASFLQKPFSRQDLLRELRARMGTG